MNEHCHKIYRHCLKEQFKIIFVSVLCIHIQMYMYMYIHVHVHFLYLATTLINVSPSF